MWDLVLKGFCYIAIVALVIQIWTHRNYAY